ncbi:DUF1659 domain-containing protein [Bacillus sp. FJAT-42376]|uniref:DUF1659 domain-containing protein n=1 Tax=Bacillus sp. FJAT-42376 TaxID=2014076 RepID=UPI000F4E5F6A|nr:DUF1659 domain-containing protein [Bacillus sp. FJAT-42376]AZB42579.1 DUF1659 domain-containing protein [Bacillus sp. FJAT-42376]
MAQTILIDRQLRLVYDLGLNKEGKQVFKSKTYSNVKPAADSDQLMAAALILSGLQQYPLFAAERLDVNEIQN